jgi:hypothetical protein
VIWHRSIALTFTTGRYTPDAYRNEHMVTTPNRSWSTSLVVARSISSPATARWSPSGIGRRVSLNFPVQSVVPRFASNLRWMMPSLSVGPISSDSGNGSNAWA